MGDSSIDEAVEEAELSRQISIVGDYAYLLSRTAAGGEAVPKEDVSALSDFSKSIRVLSEKLSELRQLYTQGDLVFEARKRLTDSLDNLEAETENRVTTLDAAFHELKVSFPEAEPLGCYYLLRKIRRHNRQLHKTRPAKGGLRKPNQSPREVKGFQLFDCVRFHGEECFVFGRRSSGYFDLRKADGTKVHASASWRDLRLLEHSGTTLKERRPA